MLLLAISLFVIDATDACVEGHECQQKQVAKLVRCCMYQPQPGCQLYNALGHASVASIANKDMASNNNSRGILFVKLFSLFFVLSRRERTSFDRCGLRLQMSGLVLRCMYQLQPGCQLYNAAGHASVASITNKDMASNNIREEIFYVKLFFSVLFSFLPGSEHVLIDADCLSKDMSASKSRWPDMFFVGWISSNRDASFTTQRITAVAFRSQSTTWQATTPLWEFFSSNYFLSIHHTYCLNKILIVSQTGATLMSRNQMIRILTSVYNKYLLR
jgi:hypothetical protein